MTFWIIKIELNIFLQKFQSTHTYRFKTCQGSFFRQYKEAKNSFLQTRLPKSPPESYWNLCESICISSFQKSLKMNLTGGYSGKSKSIARLSCSRHVGKFRVCWFCHRCSIKQISSSMKFISTILQDIFIYFHIVDEDFNFFRHSS
jgi:hypothetical protein